MEVSLRVKNMGESVTMKLNANANRLASEGKTIYNLTAGQLPFMPESSFVDCLNGNLKHLKSFQYSPAAGFQNVRDKLIKNIETSRGIDFSKSGCEVDCVISNGAKHSIYNALLNMVNPGEEVIIFAPFWISYVEMIKLVGAEVKIVDSSFENGFVPAIDEIKKAITSKTRAIILNSPNNPSGVFYPEVWMDEFANVIEQNPELYVISDEIYFDLNYLGEVPTFYYQKNSALLKQTIIMDGISKTFASPGLRIGYAVGPNEFMKAMGKLQGQTSSGPNSLVQNALLDYDFSKSKEFLGPIKSHLKSNLDTIRKNLEMSRLEKCWYQTNSAFYYMVDFRKTLKFDKIVKESGEGDYAARICNELLEETGVAIVPGTDFGIPNSARISMVAEAGPFDQAMKRLMGFLSKGLSENLMI